MHEQHTSYFLLEVRWDLFIIQLWLKMYHAYTKHVFQRLLSQANKSVHHWNNQISLLNFKFQPTPVSVLEVSKITSPFHIMRKTYLFPFSHFTQKLFFSLNFELTSYLGNVKMSIQEVDSSNAMKKLKTRKRKTLDKCSYCCQHPICCMEQAYYTGQYSGNSSPTELLFAVPCSQANNRNLQCRAYTLTFSESDITWLVLAV